MNKENSLQRMMNGHADKLPGDLEHSVVHQANTFSVFSRVVELFGPNALNIASRYICGHTDCSSQGPQIDLNENVPFWRVRP